MQLLKLIIGLAITCNLFLISADTSAQVSIASIDSLIHRPRVGFTSAQAKALNKKIYERSLSIGYKPGISQALLYMALNSFNANRYDEALKTIYSAEEIAKQVGDSFTIARILALKAECFAKLGFIIQAEKVLKEAAEYATLITNNTERHHSLGNIYLVKITCFELHKQSAEIQDSILVYSKKAHHEFSQITTGNLRNAFTVSAFQMGKAYIQLGQYDSAQYYLNKSLGNIRKFKQKMYAIPVYMSFGLLDYKAHQYESALKNYLLALQIADKYDDMHLKKEIYLGLANVYDKLDSPTYKMLYLKQYVKLSESLSISEKQLITTPADYIFKENEEIYKANKNRYILTIVAILNLFFITVAATFMLFRRFKKEKISSLEKFRLLEEKIQLLNKEEQIEPLNDEALKKTVQLAIAGDPTFFTNFKALNETFVEKLISKAPNLVHSELEICAYLKLNFETKEIARYTGLSVRAVQGIKYRIRKKLLIKTTEDLNIWMMKM